MGCVVARGVEEKGREVCGRYEGTGEKEEEGEERLEEEVDGERFLLWRVSGVEIGRCLLGEGMWWGAVLGAGRSWGGEGL